jgi:signal transduction histidine kinase
MVHEAESDSVEFEQGLFVGHQEERARIVKLFHDQVSSTMMAALFALESAKNALEGAKPSRDSGAGKSLRVAFRGCGKNRRCSGRQERRASQTPLAGRHPEKCKAD